MEEEQQQEQKQLFLRKEILEQNYDPQKFIDFLVSKKGETAADINNWTLEELKSIVVEFKSVNKNITENKTPDTNNNQNNIDKNKVKNNNIFYNDELNNEWLFLTPESNKDTLDTSIASSENNQIIEIDCLEPDQSPLSKYDTIHIKISSPKKEYESTGLKGFFMKTVYYTFHENSLLHISFRKQRIKT